MVMANAGPAPTPTFTTFPPPLPMTGVGSFHYPVPTCETYMEEVDRQQRVGVARTDRLDPLTCS
jgi:hypothetical protein